MPLIPLFFALLLPVVFVLAIPFGIINRYRLGTARRLGRAWAVRLNLILLVISAALFLWASAMTNFWVPKAFLAALGGLSGGGLLGLAGLALTRWEEKPRTLHYTPNRWLILLITFAVSARLIYGVWRGWQAWGSNRSDTMWLAEAGAAGSLAVGAIVLGYYLIFTAGIYRRLGRHRRQWGQVM